MRTKRAKTIKSSAHKFRATRAGCQNHFTDKEWFALVRHYGNRCLCCKKRFSMHKLTPDHIVPISKRGSNSINNIQPLCIKCNLEKNDLTVDYREVSCLLPESQRVKPFRLPVSTGKRRGRPASGRNGVKTSVYLSAYCQELSQVDTMTANEVCETLGFSMMTLYRRMAEGALVPLPKPPHLKRRRRLLFDRAAIEALAISPAPTATPNVQNAE